MEGFSKVTGHNKSGIFNHRNFFPINFQPQIFIHEFVVEKLGVQMSVVQMSSYLSSTRGTSILGEVRNVAISRSTKQLLWYKFHDFLAIFAPAHSKINQIA